MPAPGTTSQLDISERIRHAEAYPFTRPACSYLFASGRVHPLSLDHLHGRIPVVAAGSNAAPERLAAKFGYEGEAIPVTPALLRDFAVVFAGHFTAYGAIPATLAPCPEACAKVWITWLTPPQLDIMHRSEGVTDGREVQQRYDYVDLRGLDLRPERLPAIDEAGAYLSRRMLAPAGHPIRCAEIVARSCPLEALPERAVLRLAHRLLDQTASFQTFMVRVLSDPDQRQALFHELTPHTIERRLDAPNAAVSR
jgi:hypothetical protein